MGERRALGRSLVALTAAICTLGALAITPAANAKTVTAGPESKSASQTVKAKAAAATPGLAVDACPADSAKPVRVYTDTYSGDFANFNAAVTQAKKLAGQGNVYIQLRNDQKIPTTLKDPNNWDLINTINIDSQVIIDGQGCGLDGQINFLAGAEHSTVKNVRFKLSVPNQTSASIITNVPITVEHNVFRLTPSDTSLDAKTTRPLGVQVLAGSGTTIQNNLFQTESGTPHEQDQGVRLVGSTAGTTISNNQFAVPTGVALFRFSGTGTITGNTFTGKYAVADTSASNPKGLTYLGKTIEYGKSQDLNSNTLGNSWAYRGVFAGSNFRGTSYGVRFINAKDNTVLGSDAVVQKTAPTRVPTRTGFYADLYNDKAGTQPFNASTDLTSNRDGFGDDGDASSDLGAIYVKWYKNVKFDLNDGTGEKAPDAQKVYEDKSIDSLPDVTVATNTASLSSADEPSVAAVTPPNGKGKFLGWSTDKAATTAQFTAGAKFTPDPNSPADITLYAVYENTFTVKFDLNSKDATGDAPKDELVPEGGSLAQLPGVAETQAPKGMKFVGWSEDPKATSAQYEAGAAFTPSKAETTLYAVWAAKTVTVKFDLNSKDATGDAPKDELVPEGGSLAQLPGVAETQTPKGMKFVGWSTQSDGRGTTYLAGDPFAPKTNITLYARWVSTDKVVLYHHVNGGTGAVEPQIVGKGQSVTADSAQGLTAPQGMRFAFWSTAKDGKNGVKYMPGDVFYPTMDTMLYAQWVASDKVIVVYNSNGGDGTVPNPQTVDKKTEVMVAKKGDLIRSGWRFVGWNTQADGKGHYYRPGDKFTVTEDTVLYAQWVRIGGGNGGSGNGGNGNNGGSNNNGGSGNGQPSDDRIPVHRVYYPASGEHLWTIDENEWTYLSQHGWNDEGVAFYVTRTGKPLYRLYHKSDRVHLYTSDDHERQVLAANGWTDEGVAFYVPLTGSVQVHRLYYAPADKHLLSATPNEIGVLQMHGWKDEGLAFMAR